MNKLAVYLKVKQVSLALETKVIKKELLKYKYDPIKAYVLNDPKEAEKGSVYNGLYHHLKDIVATESRATNIARAYLRGKPYAWVESRLKENRYWKFTDNNKQQRVEYYNYQDSVVWKRVVDIVRKYENNQTYYSDLQRKKLDDVKQAVYAWRNEHPQLFGKVEYVDKVA